MSGGTFYVRLNTGKRPRWEGDDDSRLRRCAGGKTEPVAARGKHAKVMYPPCLSSSLQSAGAPWGFRVTSPKSQRVGGESPMRKVGKHRVPRAARSCRFPVALVRGWLESAACLVHGNRTNFLFGGKKGAGGVEGRIGWIERKRG